MQLNPSLLATIKDTILKGYKDIVLPFRFHSEYSLKPDGSFVTEADKNMEAFLKKQLQIALPDSLWIGEETYDILTVLKDRVSPLT